MTQLLDCSRCPIVTAVLAVALAVLWWLRRSVKKIYFDDSTTKVLITPEPVEKECAAIVKALTSAPVISCEAECAEHLRDIVVQGHLSYRTLEDDPAVLLRASRHFITSGNGALGTRFTVQYNLFAGSIVALGTQEQRETLYQTQKEGALGCFAFTELGAGVLSGAAVETLATYDASTESFIITSPTPTSVKYWISQGMYAEYAVILAELVVGGVKRGPHLFYSRIQTRSASGLLTALPGVKISSLPLKTALLGLDNAFIEFDNFRVPRSAMLARFTSVSAGGEYSLTLPAGCSRMLDLLLSRLLTGRICLSEYTLAYAKNLMRESYCYASQRELWRGRKEKGDSMVSKPLFQSAFASYTRTAHIIAHFLAVTREKVADCIRKSNFPPSIIEEVCICKFVGTSMGVDIVSAMRKIMGSRALQEDSGLGAGSFVCNATCSAEGDNTIMEMKVVGDIVKHGIAAALPLGLMQRSLAHAPMRKALRVYLSSLARAVLLGRKALQEAQLIRDIAWAKAHLIILDTWYRSGDASLQDWDVSYGDTMVRFPTPLQF